MGANRGLWAIAVLAVSVTATASCGSVADDSATGDGRTAAVYESIVQWVLDEEPGVSVGQQPDWVIFVGSRGEGQIGLDVQVAVVEALEERVFVRFIDERSEAIEVDSADAIVRDGGILVGLGAVSEDGESIDVYLDRYRDSGDIDAWWVTVRRSGTTWEIVGAPTPTEVRPQPADG